MTESEFNDKIDNTWLAIEDVLDDAISDMDYVTVGGVLTVTCESGQKLIFTRQGPVSQLWIATPGGGFHFDAEDGKWVRDTDKLPLEVFLQQSFATYAEENFEFSFD